jgi:alpha-tubulin suppressor-like RCC1 family protein
MLSGKKLIISIISLIIIITNITLADWKDDSRVIMISGGEDYTLILTQNNWLWACGNNWYYQLGISEDIINQFSPVRVYNGDMLT